MYYRICVVTGSRAEYGNLYCLMKNIKNDKKLILQVIVTGSHLSKDYGFTYKEILRDGFKINKRIKILEKGNNANAVSKSIGKGFDKFSNTFKKLKPTIVLILGDRYEMMAPTIVSLIHQIPVYHIHGGEITSGAYDDSIRNSITKMSWLHFVATKEYKKRVIQMGEDPKRVFMVGGMGVDKIKNTKLIKRNNLEKKFKFKFNKFNYLITFHPVTLDLNNSLNNFKDLLSAIFSRLDTFVIFTGPNADNGGKIIKKQIIEYVSKNKHKSIFIESMGNIAYLSMLKYVDCVIGNSSSGIVEAPTFRTGTINIGNRQKGRVQASSVINCKLETKSILNALNTLHSPRFKKKLIRIKNPYGVGGASKKILEIIKTVPISKNLMKRFYDL